MISLGEGPLTPHAGNAPRHRSRAALKDENAEDLQQFDR